MYMIVERFRNGDAPLVYARFRDHGRMAPEGLSYNSSWVDERSAICYQLMETANPALLDRWMAQWNDIVDFEVHPVITSNEAERRME
jgi:hypothetical protein